MKRRYPWGVRAALAGCVGTAPAVVYLLTGMVGPWWALFLAGVGGFLGVGTTLPGMSVGRVGRVAAAIALGPVIELASWPAPDTVGPRPPAPPPGPAVDPRWRTA